MWIQFQGQKRCAESTGERRWCQKYGSLARSAGRSGVGVTRFYVTRGGGGGGASWLFVRFLRLLAVGLLVAGLAVVGGGGAASAQTGIYFYSDSATQEFVTEADTERTNVDSLDNTLSSYRAPYVEVNVELYAGTSATPAAAVTYQTDHTVFADRGFTHDALAVNSTTNTYTSWQCTDETRSEDTSFFDPAPVTLPMGGSDSFQSAFLPYARELTLTHDGGTQADRKVCVAPEALTDNTNYNASTISAYTAPTGWSIGSSEIITPANSATVRHEFVPVRNSATSGMGSITGRQFRYTATYNTNGTLSFSCIGGANRLTGAADNSFCATTYTPSVPPPDHFYTSAAVDGSKSLLNVAETARTNVDPEGNELDFLYQPYVSVDYAAATTNTAATNVARTILLGIDPGFTHSASSYTTGTTNQFASFSCTARQSLTVILPQPSPFALSATNDLVVQDTLLPYARMLTLTHNAGTSADMTVCVAPEALEGNSTLIPGESVIPYQAPTGWTISTDSRDNPVYVSPADGATMSSVEELRSNTGTTTETSFTAGSQLGSTFIATVTYNTGSDGGTLSASCVGAYDRANGAVEDNSFCDTDYTPPSVLPPPPYFYSESSLREFVSDADSIFTNVNPDGTTNDTTYDVPYIRVLALLYAGTTTNPSPAVEAITQGTLVVGRGFTHSTAAIDATNTYISWDCSAAVQVNTSDTATETLAAGSVINALNDVILPYARELTLTHDAGTSADMTVCVAPEALTDNANYGVATITAYTAPAGWTIESSEIITPDNGAFISHSRIANSNTIALGNELTETFRYVATYNTAGDKIGNAGNALSFTCTGGSDRLTGILDNSFCTRDYTPALSPNSPDTGEPPPSFSTTGAVTSVSCGFQVDGLCRDITRYSSYIGKTLNAGSTHSFALKAYTPTTFSRFQLGIGATSVGAPIGTAQVVITVIVTRDYSTTTGYQVGVVTYDNNSAEEIIPDAAGTENINATITAITQPADNTNVTLTSEPCSASRPTRCLVVNISNLVFTDTFISPVYAIAAIDTQSKLTTHHPR